MTAVPRNEWSEPRGRLLGLLRCETYHRGHSVHWIPALRTANTEQPHWFGQITRLDPDGAVLVVGPRNFTVTLNVTLR